MYTFLLVKPPGQFFQDFKFTIFSVHPTERKLMIKTRRIDYKNDMIRMASFLLDPPAE